MVKVMCLQSRSLGFILVLGTDLRGTRSHATSKKILYARAIKTQMSMGSSILTQI